MCVCVLEHTTDMYMYTRIKKRERYVYMYMPFAAFKRALTYSCIQGERKSGDWRPRFGIVCTNWSATSTITYPSNNIHIHCDIPGVVFNPHNVTSDFLCSENEMSFQTLSPSHNIIF